jgi:dTDP-4-amino-4,6-dideoxygalactose transaminase
MGNDQDVVDRDLTEKGEETEPSFFASPKRLLQTAVVVLLLLAAIYILVPKIVGTKGAIGQLSDATSTSFIIQKNLGTFGDGGALLTHDAEIDARVRTLRNHGSTKRNVHSFGFNSRLDDIHAAILSVKLRYITKWTDRRRAIAARYTSGLQGTSFALPYEPPGYRHVFHLYVIEHDKRDHLERSLLEAGVDVKLHYPVAIHQQAGYPWGKLADANPHVPECERNAASCVSLPMFPELTQEQQDRVVGALLSCGEGRVVPSAGVLTAAE